MVAGVLTLYGSDEKQDFKAQERNGAWRVSRGGNAAADSADGRERIADQSQPSRAVSAGGRREHRSVSEGRQRGSGSGRRSLRCRERWVWAISATSIPSKQDWGFLHIPEMADWSASALLVEPAAIWVGLIRRAEDGNTAGRAASLRSCNAKGDADRFPWRIRSRGHSRGARLYCANFAGFAVIEQDHARRFEFSPQLDGTYAITPVT